MKFTNTHLNFTIKAVVFKEHEIGWKFVLRGRLSVHFHLSLKFSAQFNEICTELSETALFRILLQYRDFCSLQVYTRSLNRMVTDLFAD